MQPGGTPNEYRPELRAFAYLSSEATQRLFEGSRFTVTQILALLKKGQPPRFDLPVTGSIHTVTQSQDLRSSNVIAKLEGSDPLLKGEYVVFSAHLDHLGRDASAQGDGIYNGALDNASGSAIMLEMARAFSRMNPRPRRSILFLSVTGEELGLLGSSYFAANPTVPKSSLVANVNTDEDQMLWPLRDVIALGADHSSIGAVVQTAARRMHLEVSPDPEPEKVEFVRSDQYSFVRQGIPALSISAGLKSTDPTIHPQSLKNQWEETRYHQPSDDMQQPGLDFDSAADYARMVLLCGYLIAQDTDRPAWNAGDFFGSHFALPVAAPKMR